MIITDKHYISLYINEKLVELKDDASLSIRLNNVLFNPEQTRTTQASYSFTFAIPSTPNNDSILNHSNAIDKLNKFNVRYDAKVYADETLVFDGSIIVKGYDHFDKEYQCNLVSKKIYSLEEIFGDMVLTDIDWEIPFLGAETINAVNASGSSKYYFPLVSYGVFQKKPISCDDVGCEYTSKFAIDEYNKWWIETFYPSLNTLEVIKKAFEQKGFSVGGTVYNDPIITNIFQSVNLSNEQQPTYNLGIANFGVVNMRGTFNNTGTTTGRWMQDLAYPYLRVDPTNDQSTSVKYNLGTVDIWNMLDTTQNSGAEIETLNSPNYIYDPSEHLFVVPKSGWYKIRVYADLSVVSAGTTFNAYNYYNNGDCDSTIPKANMTFTRDIDEDCPIEVQLVKNYDNNAELIKGKWNVRYLSGDKNETGFTQSGCGFTSNTIANKYEWKTEFPHEELWSAFPPTETSSIMEKSIDQQTIIQRNYSMYGGFTETAPESIRRMTRQRPLSAYTVGYMTHIGETMPYDQAVSEAFICGISSWKASKQPSGSCYVGNVAVQKNGYSWSKANIIKNEVFARVEGMDYVDTSDNVSATTYNQNTWTNAQSTGNNSNYAWVYSTGDTLNNLVGNVSCCVWLNKNDMLELLLLQRNYDDSRSDTPKYAVDGRYELEIRAIDDKSYEDMKASNYTYDTTVRFSPYLSLSQYMSDEVKVSDWIESVLTAFNLQLTQLGGEIYIDTNRGLKKTITNAIDIDNRASEEDAETSMIDYPRTMSVRYKIDKDEWGFERTVPNDKINLKDWYNYGDSGYTIIKMSNDSYNTKESNISTNFSYTYYDNFISGGTKTIRIPVIEKSEYMADGYGYEEAAKHDGYSMTQRFWFRQPLTEDFVYLSSYRKPTVQNPNPEKVYLTYPTNSYNTVNLSYKDSEKSLLTEYFNFVPLLSSNYVTVEVYLTPEEYKQIKCGAKVKYCTDIYWASEISGFDPSGANKTTLKLIKQV